MKSIFWNRVQIKIFLALLLIVIILAPVWITDFRYPYNFGINKIISFGIANFVDNFKGGVIWYNALFAYIISILSGYAVVKFKLWRQSKLFHKIASVFSMLIVAILIAYILLVAFVRFMIADSPRMPTGPLRINQVVAREVNAQVLTFIQDLAHLRNIDSDFTRAYDKISIQDSWNAVNESEKPLRPVIIGILDTGLDKSHPEFENVKTGSSRGINLRDPDGHGTAVAGIIGANSVLGSGGTLPVDSPQMNGIVSGVSSIDYTIEMRAFLNTEKIPRLIGGIPETFVPIPRALVGLPPANIISFGAFIENLDLVGAQIVNLSFGAPKCSEMPLSVRAAYFISDKSCASDDEFDELTQMYEEIINAHQDILFVIGAGNEDMDVIFSTPANVSADHVITVAATNLNDERANFTFAEKSNFGSAVDISAPGTNVYAPLPRGHENANFPTNVPQGERNYTTNFGGTSAATPMITGTAAILKAIGSE